MFPRLKPLTVSLRPDDVVSVDPLHNAWLHVVRAREVAFHQREPEAWVRAFEREIAVAIRSFDSHVGQAEAADSRLRQASLGTAESRDVVFRQLADHARLRAALVELKGMGQVSPANPLGSFVRANDAAAMLQLYITLHHRRLEALFREPEAQTAPPPLALARN